MTGVNQLRHFYYKLVLVALIGTLALIARFPNTFAQQSPQPSSGRAVDYYRDIQPILTANCVKCHQGPAAPAELRVDSVAALMHGGTSGPAITPGSAEKSILVSRIADKGTNRMPPGGALNGNEIALISTWIDQGAKAEPAVDFTAQIEPILKTSCYSCHAGSEPKGNLHLDSKALSLQGGVSGAAILPGKGRDSLLIHRVLGEDGKVQMPRAGTPLTTEQIALLERWIDQGANRPDSGSALHWAYVKPVRPPVPAVKNSQWVRNPIDNFVLARLEKEGLGPSPVAPKETLVRRLFLDLIGLPPSPSETAAFVNDTRPDAYERLVDQLLASPHYGERMATPWLDLARYGDSNGYERDYQRVAWPYRDWVVKAFNDNKPFDQFTIEQIAGDLLPNPTASQLVATGFVRSSMLNTEGGTDGDEQLWVAQVDRAVTVGNVFLGSTIQCAQCHNHKYDPFTQKQFYQLVAFFDNIKQEIGDGGGPMDYRAVPERRILLPNEEQAARCKQIDIEFGQLNKELKADTPQVRQNELMWEKAFAQAEAEWFPLQPTNASSQNGSTLTVSPDKSILVSGANPDKDVYVVEATSPIAGEITGIRIDALPDSSLPYSGPGRDEFGNFNLNKLSIAFGKTPSEVAFKIVTNTAAAVAYSDDDDAPVRGNPNGWRVSLAEDQARVPMMLIAIPEKPVTIDADGKFRITLTQSAEKSAGLGRFRVSVTTGKNPKLALGIPYYLRPQLAMSQADRLSYDAGLVGMMNESGGRAVRLSDSLCGQPSFTTSKPPVNKNEQREDAVFTYWRNVAPEFESVRTKITALRREVVNMKIPSALVLSENTAVAHPKTFIHERGMWTAKAEEVEADVPSFLGSIKDAPPNRLGLAKWLVTPDNPLTARVRVNHIWQMIFGMGIVETAEDFGTQGFRPSHLELLDWLATEFVNSGWDQKALLRLIVTSNTYRQSSNASPALLERDPRNVLLARGARYRVEAETVRDITLSVTGLLSLKMGGPPVMPPQPPGLWSFPVAAPNDNWVESKGDDKYRRGLYVFVRRTVRYPSMLIFDAPSRETTISRRSPSNTPFQALTRLNDPAFFEAAQALAHRIRMEASSDISSRLIYGFSLVTSRKPNEREIGLLRKNYDEQLAYFAKKPDEAKDVSGEPGGESAAWVMVSNALLNLNETITRE
jgi:mono/diheme cytochrome c family protein